MKYILLVSWLFSMLIIFSCAEQIDQAEDPLPSWNDGKTKTSIVDFVNEVTNEESKNFIAVPDRIATFDNDGNLWSEQPHYFQLQFAMDRIKTLSTAHPDWQEDSLMVAVMAGDIEKILAAGQKGLMEIVMRSHTGITTDNFETVVEEWIDTATHPRFNQPYKQLIYQPMLELLDYLQSKDFKTFIVSGGGIEFIRPWAENAYGIPKDQVIGSSIKTRFNDYNGSPFIERLPQIDFIDDKAGKPVGIQKFIGRKPVFASGNSDGDLQMMQWTASNTLKSFMLYLHHTDSIREWAYDRESHIGKLDIGLDQARKKGWTVVDMKKDWKVIYPFQLDQ